MSVRTYWKVILSGLVVGLTLSAASAADWDSCADDLDRLRRAARDAADKANDVKSKSDDVKSKSEEFENCKRYPDMYDLLRDRCRSKASDYQSAQSDYRSALSDYQNALSDLESELGTVDSRIRSVRSSCGYALGTTGSPSFSQPQPSGSGNPACALYRNYKGKLPLETLLKTCTQSQSMSEAECKKCLADK